MSETLLRLPLQFFAEDAEPNAVNDAQGQVVDGQEPAAEEGVTPEQEAPEQASAKPVQSAEENAVFAKIRREAEAKAKELAQKMIDEEYKQLYAGQVNPYTGKPIESKADYLEYQRQHALHQMAEQSGVSVQEQEATLQQMLRGLPDYQQAVEEAQKAKALADKLLSETIQKKMEEDLAAIKKYNPKETAESLDDLGPTYAKCISLGMDALAAYDVVLKERQRSAPPPPSMGDINNNSSDNSDYYTLEQLKQLSPEEVRKNWDKVQRSRKRIFK